MTTSGYVACWSSWQRSLRSAVVSAVDTLAHASDGRDRDHVVRIGCLRESRAP